MYRCAGVGRWWLYHRSNSRAPKINGDVESETGVPAEVLKMGWDIEGVAAALAAAPGVGLVLGVLEDPPKRASISGIATALLLERLNAKGVVVALFVAEVLVEASKCDTQLSLSQQFWRSSLRLADL